MSITIKFKISNILKHCTKEDLELLLSKIDDNSHEESDNSDHSETPKNHFATTKALLLEDYDGDYESADDPDFTPSRSSPVEPRLEYDSHASSSSDDGSTHND